MVQTPRRFPKVPPSYRPPYVRLLWTLVGLALVQSLTIIWYAISCDPAAGLEQRRQRSPWYRAKATPAAADMHTALRDALTGARINPIGPGCGQDRKMTGSILTSEAQAA